jgi:hypothetical protein
VTDELSTAGAGFPIICSVCGYEFKPGEDYYVVQRTVLKKQGSMANLVEVVNERVMCTYDCNGDDLALEV